MILVGHPYYGRQKPMAADAGICDSYLSQILSEKKKPSDKIQIKIAKNLKYKHIDLVNMGTTIGQSNMEINVDHDKERYFWMDQIHKKDDQIDKLENKVKQLEEKVAFMEEQEESLPREDIQP